MNEKISIDTIAGGFHQMTAPGNYYLTQVEDVDNYDRLYVRRRILLASESVTDWRLANEDEFQNHQELLTNDRLANGNN